MGAILDTIKAESNTGGCSVGQVLANPEVGDDLREALQLHEQKKATFVLIARVFTDAGYPLSADLLSKHTRNGCACNR